jgi:DNA repair protein RadD
MTAPEARPYQARAIEAVRASRRAGNRRILLVSPTGSGKSVMGTIMIHRANGLDQRVLVIVHSRELFGQWHVHMGNAGIKAGVMMADDYRADLQAPVQVGTAATLARRELPPADLVVIDECSMAVADTFSRLLAAYPKATIIGLTATPCRLDGQGLSAEFDAMVIAATYSELIELGSIVAPIVYAPRAVVDLSKVSRRGGDYASDQVETTMRQAHVIGDVVETYQRIGGGRRGVVFACGIDHSRDLVESFIAAGVRAAHIDGETPHSDRVRTLWELSEGKLQIVCSVNVLAYGLDIPPIKYAAIARPTMSLALHMQMAGRILRPWNDVAPVIADHASNVDRHGLPHEDREWSLDGKAKRKNPAKCRTCPSCYAYVEGSPCPLCGAVSAGKPREVKKADGVLERINAQIAKEQTDPKRAFFDKQVSEAKKKGFAPGWPSVKFKEKFGAWPVLSWSQSVKADHAKDTDWQVRIGERRKDREKWDAIAQAKEKATQAQHEASAPIEEPEYEPEGRFDDLFW